jgi:hypothetical protein
VNLALIAAGVVAVLGAAIHGIGGELLVVRKLLSASPPPTRFGGPVMTKAMLHVTWHVTTVAFLTVGCALVLAGAILHGEAARAVALLAAAEATGFAAIVVGLGAASTRSPRSLFRHPGPLALSAVATLAWWGTLG